jgi:hypothetical protein
MRTKNIIKLLIAVILFSCTISFAKNRDKNRKKDYVNIISIKNKNVNGRNVSKTEPIAQKAPDKNTSGTGSSSSITMASIQTYLSNQDFFTRNYKPIIIISSILGAYGLSFYTIYYCKNYLENKNLWSCWKDNMSIEKLMEIPQDDFAQQVLEQIKIRSENSNNFIFSITQFMTDIEKEKNTLTLYDKIYKFLDKYYILKLFPINTKCFENLHEKIERLAYIKNVFLSSSCINYDDKIYACKKKALISS